MVDYVSNPRAAARARRREKAEVASFVRRLDWILIGTVAGLVGYGLWAIAGITQHDVAGDQGYYLSRQVAFVVIGTLGLLVATLIDTDHFRTRWRVIFGGTVAVIAIVYFQGAAIRGSKRWLDLGFFRFQPSEFGKVLFVLALAGFLAERSRRLHEVRTTLTALGLASIPIFLVFLQPDFGTALVYCAAVGAVLFVAGTPWTHVAALAAGAVTLAVLVLAALPAAGLPVLKDYQQKRLTSFLNPDQDPGGTTYNITQSKNAIGAGQLRGRGVDNATQTTLNFLPEHHTDFVFAVVGERWGFIGAALILSMYALLIWRGLRILTIAKNLFGALIAGGVVSMLLFQVFINVGMTIGIMPITGIPLPLLSYGGSSVLTTFLAVGLLQSIYAQGRASAATKGRGLAL